MIYFLGRYLSTHFESFSFLRLADYLTVRAIGAALTAIILTLSITPIFIRYLHRRGLVQQDVESSGPAPQGQPQPGAQSRPHLRAPSPVPAPLAS